MQKEKKAKNCKKGKEAAVASASTAPSPSKDTQRKGIGLGKSPPSLLSNRKETEAEGAMDGGDGGSGIEENEGSFVDIDDILDPEGAPDCRIPRLDATQKPPVVEGFSKS